MELIGTFPEIGAVRDDFSPGIRCFVRVNYLILYRVTETEVRINRVIHGKQELERFFPRRPKNR